MKAIVCHTYGPVGTLRWEDIPSPKPARGEVRIAVQAAGVNFADALKVQGKHQVKVALPWTPGCELAGVITEIGDGVSGLQVGHRVLAVPDDRAGGFAEEVVVRAERALVLPVDIAFEQASAIPSAYGTALYALRQRGAVSPMEWVLVLGAGGGVGLAAVQVAAAMGARVIAGASTEEKRGLAMRHGAMHAVDYTKADWRAAVLEITGKAGVDVVFDPVGGDTFDEAVRTVGWDGRYLVVGFAGGRIPELKVNHPLVKGYGVVGVRYDVWRDRFWDGARANIALLLRWLQDGRLHPIISRVYPFSQASDAMTAFASREALGKMVLSMGPDPNLSDPRKSP